MSSASLEHSKKLNKRLKRARKDEPEGVHEARTEIRRARILLDVMARNVFPTRKARRLERDLRLVERQLAKARDSEVTLAALDDHLREHPEAEVGLEDLVERLQLRRARAVRRARRKVTPSVRRALVRRLRDMSSTDASVAGDCSPKAVPALVRHFTHGTVWAYYEELRAYDAREPSDADVLHRFRSRARRLRYALELFGAALPTSAAVIAELIAIQDDIGSLHDGCVAAALIERWRRRGEIDDTPELRGYIERLDEDRAELLVRCRRSWAMLLGRAFRERVASVLASEAPAAAALEADRWRPGLVADGGARA